jgi:hypothetical protein
METLWILTCQQKHNLLLFAFLERVPKMLILALKYRNLLRYKSHWGRNIIAAKIL